MTLLTKIYGVAYVKYDTKLVGRLVKMLPSNLEWEWAQVCGKREASDIRTRWEIFEEWLDALRDTALQSRLTQLATSNATTQGKPVTPIVKPTGAPLVSHKPMIGLRNHCYICGRGNHLAKDCREPHKLDDNAALVEFVEVNALADQFLSDTDRAKAFKRAEERFGRCPLCKNAHTYQRSIGGQVEPWPSSQLRSCSQWMEMNPEERGMVVEQQGACPKCTSWQHGLKKCWRKRTYICGEKEGNQVCHQKHDPLLHGAKNNYCLANAASEVAATPETKFTGRMPKQPVMLIAQTIMAGATNGVEREAGTFFDNGSTLYLALHRWAKAAGCPSTPYKLGLRVVGKESYENVDTRLYTVALKADTGELYIVKCIGMDTISHIAKVDSIDEVAARLQVVKEKDLNWDRQARLPS